LNIHPNSVAGLTMGYIPYNATDPMTGMVQLDTIIRISGYNFGVMPNNFVRLTLQFACFENNPNSRWRAGYPHTISKVMKGRLCSNQPCMKDMMKKGGVCKQFDGELRDLEHFVGSWSKINYTYSEKGTFGDLGGVSVGLGNTRKEASFVIYLLQQDEVLRQSVEFRV